MKRSIQLTRPTQPEMEEDFIQIFARVHLGPESAQLVEMPEVEESIQARMASGTSPEDAVLAEVHAR